jgi:hypothetical protein
MLAGKEASMDGQAYSLDLRKRVVAAIKGGMSRNQAASQAFWGRDQHGNQLDAAGRGYFSGEGRLA